MTLWLALAGLSGTALARDDVSASAIPGSAEPSLATRLKYGLRARVPGRDGVQIIEVELYESAHRLTVAQLDQRLLADEWLPVGILHTRDQGRLRVTCHLDACIGQAGDTVVNLQLLTEPPPPLARGRHRGSRSP